MTTPEQVPADTPVVLAMTIGEAQLIGNELVKLPYGQVGALIMNLNAQLAQQLHSPRPPNGVPPPGVLSADVNEVDRYADGKAALEEAEALRREVAGAYPVAPLPGETPDDDYASALLLVQLAQQHLDEAVPNGQVKRTRAGLQALRCGVALIHKWFARRDPQGEQNVH
jgi:hypothetical protein